MSVYGAFQALVRSFWGRLAGLEVSGKENVPPSGGFLLIANHQSLLDPLLIQSVCPRPVYAMAKSTQFSAPVVGWLMARHLRSFPVRRYEVDPQAVRLALRYVGAGEGVAVYVEGERSWDGGLQPPRRGAVRLAMGAGVPVIPCVIDGSYEAWPRWARRFQLRRVAIRFEPPLQLPPGRTRADRFRGEAEATARIVAALQKQG